MASTITAAAPADLAAVVRQEMERWSVPGMAVGVLRDGEIEAWGFGVASIETEQPVRPDTLFQIGSITKVVTTTVIMQLVDEGKVDLDQPVVRCLPSFKLGDEAALGAVTVRHLLTHMTGFWGDRFDDFGLGDEALTKALATFDQLRQWTPPGEVWAYCNTGFQAAGAIIEHLLGTTVEEAVRDRVFKPLGMERSFFFPHEAITYAVAVGHNKLPGKELEVARPYPLMRAMNAAGGIISTAGDLLRFARFHMSDGAVDGQRVLSADAIQAMQTPQVEAAMADHWGLGWSLRTVDGVKMVGHGGSTNGFRALLTFIPDRRVAVALLTNGSGGAAANRNVETWALERYAGLRRRDPSPTALPPEALARVAGRYERPNADITVSPTGEGLRVEVLTKNPFNNAKVVQPPMHAVPVGERRFLITDGESEGSTFDFIPGEGDTPRFIRIFGRLADRIGDA